MTLKLKKSDSTPTEVVTNIYIGSIGAAYNRDSLEALGITHVLVCADSIAPIFPSVFNHRVLPLKDTHQQDLAPHLDSAHEFIDEAISQGSGVLVHCFKGQSRSAAIIASYLIKQ